MASNSSPAALITGGTSGIGMATALLLHERGYQVVVTGRNPQTLDAARRAFPAGVTVLPADAASLADAARVAAHLEEHVETIDFVLLNAALEQMAPFEEVDEESFDAHFATNVKGQFFLVQKLLPLLKRGSAVVFTSSILAEKAMPNMSVYSGTKGAQLALVRALAVELAPRGIRVNAVAPGPVDTPALEKLGLPSGQLKALKDDIVKQVPLGRFATPEEIAGTVAFLASPDAAFITGATTVVGGGFGVAVS